MTNVVEGNFAQGQVSITVQGAGVSGTVGGDPACFSTPLMPLENGLFYALVMLTGTVDYAGATAGDFFVTLRIQLFSQMNTPQLLVDKVFLRPAAVPEPASLAVLSAEPLGLAAMRHPTV